jgi:hypothetical protein
MSEHELKKSNGRYAATLAKEQYMKSCGHNVETIWECKFKKKYGKTDIYKQCRAKYVPEFFSKYTKALSESEILKHVQNENLFGMVEVDIQVPDQWNGNFRSSESPFDYFKDFPHNL